MKEDKDKKEEKKRPFFKGKRFWVVLAVVAALVGFFYYRNILSKKSSVKTAKVEKGAVSEVLTLSGNIDADNYAKLGFSSSGDISWVGVSEGDEVKKGQGLIKLDTTVLNSVYQQAVATLRAADAAVEDVHDQVKDHTGDETYAQKDTRTAAEVTKDKAYESYLQAQYNLRHATITSPFDGIVTYLAHTFPGVNVLYTETQVEVLDPETMYFDVSADQSEVLQLSVGQDVDITLDSIPDEPLKGKVEFIAYTPDPTQVGTNYKVRVSFNESNLDIKKYRIGLSGDANFVTKKKDDALYVPTDFIGSDSSGKYVRKSSENNKTYIDIGLEGPDKTEIISSDIKEGDTVFD